MEESSQANTPESPKGEARKQLALEDVLLALQKSFSRLSNASRDVPPSEARALIMGPVTFELTIRLTPESDRLFHRLDGDMQLKLNGTLHPDIRVDDPEPKSPPAEEKKP